MDVGFCSRCCRKSPTQRKHGITYYCNEETTHMDVTYFTREKHVNEQNGLCPLIKQNGG